MKPHKIKDNSTVSKESLSDIAILMKKISDKTLGQLEREGIFVFPNTIKKTDDLTDDQIIIQSYNDTYKTGNVMGFIGLGNERLIIGSRFGCGDNDYLFQYLLEQVLGFPNIVDLETSADDNEKLNDLMVFLFPKFLKEAMRKGLFKTYIRRSYNDENVRGTINIARHIKQNTPFIGEIAYDQKEFSYDNYLSELIRHTIEFIKGKSFGSRLLNSVNDEVKAIVEATPSFSLAEKRKIIDKNKKNMVRHAYYQEYDNLQRLCILILQNHKQQIGTGSQNTYGILFDGAWLWEEYINLLIGENYYHPMNKAQKGAECLFDKGRGRIYPDFISKQSIDRVIADAKYKPIDNIGNKDYLQLLAYMFRFNSERGFYLYPENGGNDEEIYLLNRGVSFENNVSPRYDIKIIKLGLKIPDTAVDYADFVNKIKQNEDLFKERLNVQ